MVVSKTSDHLQIKIKMPNQSQVPPVSSKARYQDLKYMDILCKNQEREQKLWNMGILKTSNYIQIQIKIHNPNQEPTMSPKAHDVDIKVES